MIRPPATKDRTRQHVTVKYTVKAHFVSDLGIFEQGKHSIVRSSCVGSVCVMMTISYNVYNYQLYVHIYRLYTM